MTDGVVKHRKSINQSIYKENPEYHIK